jgi:hypothetical protein
VDQLILERGVERLGHRVVVADPGAPDGMPDIVPLQRLRELPGRVVAASVGMEDRFRASRLLRAAIAIARSMSGVL